MVGKVSTGILSVVIWEIVRLFSAIDTEST